MLSPSWTQVLKVMDNENSPICVKRNASADHLAVKLHTRGVELSDKFEDTENIDEINEAISALQAAVDLTQVDNADLPEWLSDLGNAFQSRFEYFGDFSDIAEAVSTHQKAVKLTPEGHADLPMWLNNLGISSMRRFQYTGDLSAITESIASLEKAVNETSDGHESLSGRLTNLGNAFHCRFQEAEDLSDVTEAIAAQRRAVSLTPSGHPNLPALLTNLGTSLNSRFVHLGDLSDITEAILVHRKAVDLTPEGHQRLPTALNNLGNSLGYRFEVTGAISDIDEAISTTQKAITLTPEGHAYLPIRLGNLAGLLRSRFERTGELTSIDEAISTMRKAIDLTPEDHPDLSSQLSKLGVALMCRFERTGDVADVTESIGTLKKGLDLIAEGHPDRPFTLNLLGISFQCRFERFGDLSDINEAISALQHAVNVTPESHSDLPTRLSNLGNAFQYRFQHSGDLSDIAEAISAHRQAVSLTPDDHVSHSAWLNNLGIAFRCRFECLGELSDINEAVLALQKAVEITTDDHVRLSAWLNNLGDALSCRFESTHNLSDIEESISAHEIAVNRTPSNHVESPKRLNNLGVSLQARFDRLGDINDINRAILIGGQALSLTPEGHSDIPCWAINLGNSLHSRAVSTNDHEDLNASIINFKLAATSSSGAPRVRLSGAKKWSGYLYRNYPTSPEVLPAFDVTVRLVALVAGLDQTVHRRYTQLQGLSGIVLEAAAAAFKLDRVDRALEWLEQGRCLVWNQLNTLRTPLDDLHAHDTTLAQRIMAVSQQLQNSGSSQVRSHPAMSLLEKISLEDEARARVGLAREWEELLTGVRSIPGFESFLQPSPCSILLQHLPPSGFVIVVNIDEHSCDAIVLVVGLDPLHIPLPNFSLEKANKYRSDLKADLERQGLRIREEEGGASSSADFPARPIKPAFPMGRRGTNAVRGVLRGLWTDVVEPILNKIGLSKVEQHPRTLLPRIWWCPTGALTFLPIHAAGRYEDRKSESILDYAVSSYTLTITALTDRVKNQCPVEKAVSGLFLTSQPNVPGASAIFGTTREVQSVYAKAVERGVRVLKREGSTVTVEECLKYMEDFSSVHMACHASQNAAEPLRSRFLIHNGSLDLGTIIRSNFKDADLAFLSACQTSTGEDTLSDEAVHLAAGMLAAGYRRVVATMWSIGDKPAQEVANDFYEYLWSQEEDNIDSRFDGTLSAYALHHAIQRLRLRLDSSERSLLTWIPYVHFGY
ncbi:TPR-like protein [Ephemerocybe angulata]|uniref:TPR-like protein n=1 Tax=Ephemerocybe angulata TaxID=980116 RepID=A0A8H6IJ70_9AGAR|nr:TPR-like protein [Tulosesus angulatus]